MTRRRPNRLLILMPHGEQLYGRYLAEWTRLAVWVMHRGNGIVLDIIPEVGHGFPDPHNRCVERAREHRLWRQCDYVVIMEHDHIFPTNLLERIANYTDPVVGAFYCQRVDPFWPVSIVPKPEHWDDERIWRGEGWSKEKMTFLWPSLMDEWLKRKELQQVLGMGMGMTAIRRDVLDSWPTRLPFLHPSGEEASEATYDVLFCRNARRLGYDVYQDFALELPHIAPHPITSDDHMRAMERKLAAAG